MVEANYVGNKGTRLGTNLMNINELDPKYLALGSLLSRPVTSAEAQAAGIGAPYAGFTKSVGQALRPYPQYLAINQRSNPNGNSTYHALQMKAEKRMSMGLTWLAYTWSKALVRRQYSGGRRPLRPDVLQPAPGEGHQHRRCPAGGGHQLPV